MKHFNFDDFGADWERAAPTAAIEPVANRLRRLESLTVTWRGATHSFEPDARLIFGDTTPVLSRVTLWPPTPTDHPWPRHCWTADVLIRGFGFVEGRGESPQQALDALSAELPANATSMVRGGCC